MRFNLRDYYRATEECPKLIEDLQLWKNIRSPYLESIELDECSIIGHFKNEAPVRPELFNKTLRLKILLDHNSFKTRCFINTDKNYLSDVCH